MKSIGTLYVVGTPIGNLEDITFRAVKTLKEVDHIFCEDTRITRRILQRYDINTPMSSYTSWSGIGKIRRAIRMIDEGKSIALVSDAGTPSISDPGVKMVGAVRDEFGGNAIRSIPGPSAVIAALSSSGAPSSSFVFLGFLPKKKGRNTIFQYMKDEKRTIVFYESPHRLLKTLNNIKENISKNKEIIVAREMTKIYESYINGSIDNVIEHFETYPQQVKGEIVIIINSLSK